MITKLLKSFVVAAAAVSALGAVQAQELKIGYVNSERVLKEATPAKAQAKKPAARKPAQ